MQKKGKFDESLLVYRQIPPEISLEDLPASPIYRGHPEKEMVTFLINVSWGTEYIPHILEVLKEKQVKATFFIEGKWAKENAEYVKMIADEDHIIGNHAYDHPDMARLSSQEITEQIEHTNAIIKSIIDEEPKWFAPPSGSYNNEVVKIADDLDMETIMWTVDTIDWKNPSVSVMIDRVMNHIHPGATILMHPTASVTRGLDELIDRIQQQGFRTGSIENLLSEKREYIFFLTERYRYRRINMVEQHICKHGLRIVTESIPSVRSVTIGIWVLTGSRHETEETDGMSHFLEHMLFKGTKTRTAKDIAEAFDAIGGQVNAFTSKEYTCFYAKVIDTHKEYALDILADMFF